MQVAVVGDVGMQVDVGIMTVTLADLAVDREEDAGPVAAVDQPVAVRLVLREGGAIARTEQGLALVLSDSAG